MTIFIQMVMNLLTKLAAQELLEFTFIQAAQAISKSTKTKQDDKFVDKARKILGE